MSECFRESRKELHDRLGAMIDQIGQPDYSLRELVIGLREVRDELLRSENAAIGEVMGHEQMGRALVQWDDNGIRPIGMKVYAAPQASGAAPVLPSAEGLRPCGCTLGKDGKQVDMCSFHIGEMLARAERAATQSATRTLMTPEERKELIRWHEWCAPLCAQTDDFGGESYHKRRAAELRSNATDRKNAPRHTGYEPDCADCPTPAECKAKSRCAVMDQIRPTSTRGNPR